MYAGRRCPLSRPRGQSREVLEHPLAVGDFPWRQLLRRSFERELALRPGLSPRSRAFDTRAEALKADGVAGADVFLIRVLLATATAS